MKQELYVKEVLLPFYKKNKLAFEKAHRTSNRDTDYLIFLESRIAEGEYYLKFGSFPKYKKIGTWESHPGKPWGLTADLVDLNHPLKDLEKGETPMSKITTLEDAKKVMKKLLDHEKQAEEQRRAGLKTSIEENPYARLLEFILDELEKKQN